VTGATGYIGGRLVPEVLQAGHTVRCLARTPSKLDDLAWREQVEVVRGDITDRAAVADACAGIDAAYFLVHSMGGTADFAAHDRTAAATFRGAATDAGVRRIVYLGGLGDDGPGQSSHLDSRHEVGTILADGPVPVTELRAAVIIGSGSASFEMLRNLVEVLPAMVTPRWVTTRCQPVAIRDMLHYLVAAIDEPHAAGRVLEVGGPDVLTYLDMMRVYAEIAGLPKRLVVQVPVLTPRLSSHWIGLVTPLPAGLAKPLVESLSTEVVVHDHAIDEVLPHECLPFREAVARALQRVEHLEVSTRWSGADLPGHSPADPLPSDPDWAGGTMLADVQEAHSTALPDAVFRTVSGIGGKRGWYVATPLWAIRGWMDRAVGGVGLRRGRRHPDDLRVGDALDFWRVEAYEPSTLLRLRAEMRLPGEAWLEWRIEPTDPADPAAGCTLHQRALFHPRGLWGRAYWYSVLPFHALIFGRLCHALADTAAAAPPASAVPSDELPHSRR
jgi:uncharacterized protein YbjT (DUF2867 family)